MDGSGFDETLDTNSDGQGDPCNEKTLDVKATDEDVPPLFRWLPFAPSPKSHAVVEAHQVFSAIGVLPFSVP